MRELLELVENLGTSEPVFTLTPDHDGHRISAKLQNKYVPSLDPDNILSSLVEEAYEEKFDSDHGRFTINRAQIAFEAMDAIRNLMQIYLSKNSGMKAPSQSKIWKWYRYEQPKTDEYNDMLVMVYKYLRMFASSDMNISKWNDAENNKNALALLQAIMERYE